VRGLLFLTLLDEQVVGQHLDVAPVDVEEDGRVAEVAVLDPQAPVWRVFRSDVRELGGQKVKFHDIRCTAFNAQQVYVEG
jgi:hypothetical protein